MVTTKDLLIEIGTAELPPKALTSLSAAFSQGVIDGLKEAGLAATTHTAYAAPRRLAIWLKGVPTAQADQTIERRGPALKAAFDADGKPTKAVQGFARSCGVEIEQLQPIETPKGTWLGFSKTEPGKATTELLADIVQKALDKLPIPKRMRWGDSSVEFVRPAHWILMLSGSDIVDANVLNIQSGNVTYGHRFHHPDAITINTPADYAQQLQDIGKVVANFEVRQAMILEQTQATAQSLGAKAKIDPSLLDEVTALVEWPVAIAGAFDEKFLSVPQEALISAMQDHQKYFPVVDENDQLKAHFITIANIESKKPESIRQGNERVIRPRFSDAEFFWNQDRKQRLEVYAERSKSIVFQKQLGTLYEKTQRVSQLAVYMASKLGVDQALTERAAQLAKCDLMTDMVGEFPELQGIMGRYYAQNDGEHAQVVDAMDEQYMPRFAGDQLPQGQIGQILSMADKIDTLCGIFAIGQKPTGTKDPFGLRRAALGVLRIMIECKLDLDLADLLREAGQHLQAKVDANSSQADTLAYILERLKAYYQDAGIPVDNVEAVARLNISHPLDFDQRVRAVSTFRNLPEAEALAAANKRIANILKKISGEVSENVAVGLFVEPQETALFEAIQTKQEQVSKLYQSGNYQQALIELASLRSVVDDFFDGVMIMADDELLKNNRIAMLSQLRGQFLQVADLSYLQF